jgi:LPS-assembly protein
MAEGWRVAAAALLVALTWIAGAAAQGRRDGAPEQPVLFIADELRVDQELGLVVAAGNVEIAQGKRRLLADTVTYNQKLDLITASGNVSLIEPTGEVLSGSYIELNDRMSEGFATDVRVLMTDRARLAGNAGRRTGDNRLEVRKGVYSPCDSCRDKPTAAPLWQIKAGTIVHDDELNSLEYFNAILEFAGIPVFYIPYFSHPDPTVKRRSGFLPPVFGNSKDLGFNTTVSYFWAIDRDKDLTLSPIFTSKGGQVAAGEYRQRFANGELSLSGSVNDSSFVTSDTRSASDSEDGLRYHAFGRGRFDLDERWRTGFDLRRTSDQTYLRRFRFLNTQQALLSNGFVEAFEPRAYFSANSYAFQALRQNVDDARQPVVLPLLQWNLDRPPDLFGGRLSLDANVENLYREDGTDTRRVSAGGEWRLPLTGPAGTLWTVGGSLRGDAYYVSDFVRPGAVGMEETGFEGRLFPQTFLEFRWPWVRRSENWGQLIEPIAGVYLAPTGIDRTGIPNDDSETFDFDENDLFTRNRFYGRDRIDEGQRVDYGVRTAVFGRDGGGSQFIVGQSYRLNSDSIFPAGSGLDDRLSDIVGRLSIFTGANFDLSYRFRVDRRSFAMQRQEVGLFAGPDQARFAISYLELPPRTGEVSERKQLTVGATVGLTRYWRASFATVRNLSGENDTLASALSALYQDECLALTLTVAQSGTRDRDIEPGTSFFVTLVLKNLGEITAPVFSTTAGAR